MKLWCAADGAQVFFSIYLHFWFVQKIRCTSHKNINFLTASWEISWVQCGQGRDSVQKKEAKSMSFKKSMPMQKALSMKAYRILALALSILKCCSIYLHIIRCAARMVMMVASISLVCLLIVRFSVRVCAWIWCKLLLGCLLVIRLWHNWVWEIPIERWSFHLLVWSLPPTIL